MKESKQAGVRNCAFLLVCALVFPSLVLAQGEPDIVWTTNAHPGGVDSIAFSTSGDLLAAGGEGSGLVWWQLTSGRFVPVFTSRTNGVGELTFSPDGSFLATASWLGTIEDYFPTVVWRVADRTVVWGVRFQGAESLSFSPDGTRLAATGNTYINDVRIYNVADGTVTQRLSLTQVGNAAVAFSQIGTELAVAIGWGSYVQFYSVSNWTQTRAIRDATVSPNMLDYSPDGKMFAVAGPWDRFSPPTAQPGFVWLYDVNNLSLKRTLTGHADVVFEARFLPSGKTLVSVGRDNTIRFWRVASGQLLKTYDQETTGATSIAVSSDGKLFAYGRRDGTVVVARVPVHLTRVDRGGGQTLLEWEGGAGPYQIQQSTNVAGRVWENVGGLTTNTTAILSGTNTQIFYRVQSLPGSP
jgi:WD40 repeat protein